jgi:hypothetical protein
MMKAINTKFVSVVAAFLSASSGASAQAVLTSDVTSIVVGQSITYSVVIPQFALPPPGVSVFDGGGATFQSGDGQSASTLIGATGGGGITFTYLTPGSYVASVSGIVAYSSLFCDFSGCHQLLNGGSGPGSLNFTAFESITVSVPEPATWAMMLLGFAGLGFALRHSRRKASFA